MKKPLTLLLVAAAALLNGCASMSEAECRNNDMLTKGIEDGEAGRTLAQLAAHREACGKFGITLDGEAYRRGREQGLTRYCTPANGERIGRAGGRYQNVCPPALESAFLQTYRRAYLQYQVDQKQAQLSNLRQQLLDKKLDDKKRISLLSQITEVQAEINNLLLQGLDR